MGAARRQLVLWRPWPRWRRSPLGETPPIGARRWCCICGWSGDRFEGVAHCESAECPRCGSIARDRFLLYPFTSRHPGAGARTLRVLETSPRLDERYRAAMGRWFDYTCSDYDERAHQGQIQVDLQDIDLPDRSFDVVLCAHVLEHVPDTMRALGELRRILADDGRLYLQVPLLQGTTAPPTSPEFHGDDTPVHWRFGWDLLEMLESVGFEATPLVPAGFVEAVNGDGPHSAEFAVDEMAASLPVEALVPVGDRALAEQVGWEPAYMFVTFEAVLRH